MASLTVDEFLDVVQRSGLLDVGRLDQVVAECHAERKGGVEPITIAEALVGRGLITPWQQENLLGGKSRGYFLGGYRLLSHIGAGGMSSVFLARHGLIERVVAIKVLPASRVGETTFLDRFLREARVTARLSHPNIVRVFDIDQDGDTHYIVMEFISGQDLKVAVKQNGPLPLELAADYVMQAAIGLQHAHEHGLVHRDVKPANLVVNDQGVLKVLDLGLARVAEGDELAKLTIDQSGGAMGTADYLSPEQARNAHRIDHRADIYSLGCTFYFLLAGQPPFTQGSMAERILMHQTEKPKDVRAFRADCPHALADVCMTMLAKDPDDRFASANEVARRLQRWLLKHGHVSSAYVPDHEFVSDQELLLLGVPRQEVSTDAAQPSGLVRGAKRRAGSSSQDGRKGVARRAMRTPIALWLFLAVSCLVSFFLLLSLLFRT